MADLVSVIEAAYRAEGPDRAWVAGLVEAARPLLDRGSGVFGGLYDATDVTRFRMRAMAGSGVVMEGWARLLGVAARRVAPSNIRAVFRETTCGTLSDTIGEQFLRENSFARQVARFGIRDSLGINGADPSGRGVILCVPQAQIGGIEPGTADIWSRIAAHLVAGLRLRLEAARLRDEFPRSLDRLDRAEAILDPDGRLQHAVGDATTEESRTALRSAAVALDRARGSLRRTDPDGAIANWTALVDGRWTIVDHFDRDGRRFVIAERNEPVAPACDILTRRERQIVGYVAMGYANKLIAYHLGLAVSTIASHVSSASTRLGAASRVDLIRRFVASRGQRTAPPVRRA